ncbi:UDP-glucose flavonoid 3-O-glucosyltransferase 3-like [Dorcoceras hygrometricum]|uniref:Glycosyltransferase n=1 Tax=Dorcoceras hygrometricum TaxID=472368 RepID=A0A2Z7B9Z3_9LAMI|nr:UDP-glucose flavonoid 3-O-glucosyltransferase 3-like [Dorcoceras hygrometricum]
MTHITLDGNPPPPVKVVEYLETSMSSELLSKFPDNSAFDFDYSQSSIWSPLLPRTFANGLDGCLELSRKLQYDENDFSGLLKNSKKFAANIKKKFTSVVTDNICMYQRMKMKRKKSIGFSPVPSSGRLKASSPTPRKIKCKRCVERKRAEKEENGGEKQRRIGFDPLAGDGSRPNRGIRQSYRPSPKQNLRHGTANEDAGFCRHRQRLLPRPTPRRSGPPKRMDTSSLVLSHRSNVAEYIRNSNAVPVVVDMLCTPMIDVADEFHLPSYVFFTSPASFLGAMLHFQVLHDEKNQDVLGLKNSVSDLQIPSLANPFPPEALPLVLVEKNLWLDTFLHYAHSAYGRATIPPVYPLGPILNRTPSSDSRSSEIICWLDKQPSRSVVLTCFGSQGSLQVDQVRELANGLERSGHRFLWALRRQSPDEKQAVFPSEYMSHTQVLPDGFLDRTSGIGKVVGWVPQLDVLLHESFGGFVSHCGWNSVLESVWCGVPLATVPPHTEQQMNAFQVARDLGLGVEIALTSHERCQDWEMVKGSQVERGIRELMDGRTEVRKRIKEMSEKSRICVMEGGCSYINLGRLIANFLES